jgi:hypothetical protein
MLGVFQMGSMPAREVTPAVGAPSWPTFEGVNGNRPCPLVPTDAGMSGGFVTGSFARHDAAEWDITLENRQHARREHRQR